MHCHKAQAENKAVFVDVFKINGFHSTVTILEFGLILY